MKYCSDPFEVVNIHSNGFVSPCLCNAWHTLGRNMKTTSDNLNYIPLEDLFNGRTIVKLRESIIDQSFKYCDQTQCPKVWNLDQVDQIPYLATDKLKPKALHLHIDYNCTLKCPSCRTGIIHEKPPNPNTVKILNELTRIYATETAEVIVYADGYGDLFASTAYQNWLNDPNLPKCFKFCFTTNGNLILKNLKLIEKLKSQIDIITISLDAANADTYRSVRGGNFNSLLQGIEALVSMGIRVTTQFIVQRQNYLEIPDYIKLSRSLGVIHIGLQKLDRWPHMSDDWWSYNQLEDNPAIDLNFLQSTLLEIKTYPDCNICGGLENLIK
jgi:MoaA/NifB/PqqE/SkfB family radical SAM enzyme